MQSSARIASHISLHVSSVSLLTQSLLAVSLNCVQSFLKSILAVICRSSRIKLFTRRCKSSGNLAKIDIYFFFQKVSWTNVSAQFDQRRGHSPIVSRRLSHARHPWFVKSDSSHRRLLRVSLCKISRSSLYGHSTSEQNCGIQTGCLF